MLKNSSTLAVFVPINLSIKLGFVSVNGPGKTYFVDALHGFVANREESIYLPLSGVRVVMPVLKLFVITPYTG